MSKKSYLYNKKTMYTLYHIPKRKEWGCTTNLEKRLERLNYTHDDLDRVITVGDIHKAADMEKQLNLEYGYGWNKSQDYRRVIKVGLSGAKKGGDKNKESGWIYDFQKRSVEARTGTTHTIETIQKISSARLGQTSPRKNVTLSAETKLKMSEARKAYWDLKKQNK